MHVHTGYYGNNSLNQYNVKSKSPAYLKQHVANQPGLIEYNYYKY